MCRVLAVHFSGFYAWVKEPLSQHALEDARQTELIRQAWTQSGKVYGYRKLTDDLRDADNSLDRHFEVDAPDMVWVTDITFIKTHEGWSYLAVVIDLFSRRVVGWSTRWLKASSTC